MFMIEYYLPSFETYMYHMNYGRILSNTICDNLRKETGLYVPGSILSVRDYSERLLARFNLEIQSDHFETGRNISIEGYNIEFIDINDKLQ